MITKTLQPIRDRDEYSKRLGQLLAYDLYHMIYKPLIDLLTPSAVVHNAKSSVLIKAFAERKIYFSDGFVYGKFNAAISKALKELGASFNKTRSAFKLELTQLPPEIRSSIAQGTTVEKDAIDRVMRKIQELSAANLVIPGVDSIADETLQDLHKQFHKVTPADLEIPVEMNDASREKIKADYISNIDLKIKGWGADAIERVRDRVILEVGAGTRAEKLKDVLFSEFGVTESRVKFIARQETSLFVSKFRQTRYEDAGIDQYRWSTSNDERVRDDHKDLNNRVFSWDNPPIVDKRTGRKANPGEDFGCRCVALPVFKVAGVDVLNMNSKRNSKTLRIDLKPAEYFELVKEGFGYPTIGHLLATLLTDKVEDIKKRMADGAEFKNPMLEYKWTGKRIMFWQDGRHRVKACLDEGVESVAVDVLMPDHAKAIEEAFKIMPTWFIDKLLKSADKLLTEVANGHA